MKPLSWTALLTACVLLLGSHPPASAQDACALLTQTDVEKVFGQGVTRGTRRAPSCAWDTGTPIGGMTIDLLEATPARLTKGSKPTIPGLGDDAFFTLQMKSSVVLTAIKGNKAVTIAVMFPIGTPAAVTNLEDAAQSLARIALGKL